MILSGSALDDVIMGSECNSQAVYTITPTAHATSNINFGKTTNIPIILGWRSEIWKRKIKKS